MDMNQLADQVSNLADFVWNGLLLYLLVGTGIIFSACSAASTSTERRRARRA